MNDYKPITVDELDKLVQKNHQAWLRGEVDPQYIRKAKRQKNRTRSRTKSAIKRGEIQPLPCQHNGCAETNAQEHHPDYDDPLNVIWLCDAHHRQLHKSLGRVLPVSIDFKETYIYD